MGNTVVIWNKNKRDGNVAGSEITDHLDWLKAKFGGQVAYNHTMKHFDLMPRDKQAKLREVFGSDDVFGNF